MLSHLKNMLSSTFNCLLSEQLWWILGPFPWSFFHAGFSILFNLVKNTTSKLIIRSWSWGWKSEKSFTQFFSNNVRQAWFCIGQTQLKYQQILFHRSRMSFSFWRLTYLIQWRKWKTKHDLKEKNKWINLEYTGPGFHRDNYQQLLG